MVFPISCLFGLAIPSCRDLLQKRKSEEEAAGESESDGASLVSGGGEGRKLAGQRLKQLSKQAADDGEEVEVPAPKGKRVKRSKDVADE